MKKKDYQKYVKKKLWKDFEKYCKTNSTDSYSNSVVTSAHIIMENLSHPQKGDAFKTKKMSCKEAWESGIKGHGHSGMSAAYVAVTVARFAPRGTEFKKWCIKDDIVMVDWSVKKK